MVPIFPLQATRKIPLGLLSLFLQTTLLHAQAPRLSLIPVVSNTSQPVLLTNAKDGTGRRFIVEQGGRILVLPPQSATPTLFLDITSRVLFGGERGLLGLAFHPQFATNRRFFVNYTRRPDGATVVAEYRDGVEQRILFTVPQPYENHNGGMVEFGPDGYLYIGMGDGGAGNDPQNRAQNPNELLGKMLRINVDVPNSMPEIFALGLRNPWRFSFDRLTGQLYAGDVGQGAREEIDIIVQGGNYGWRVWEGTVCTGLGPAPCSTPGFIPPIADYVNTGDGGRCAIIGGYVYRGIQASLPYGAYVYGDLCSGEIFMLKDGAQTVLLDTALEISSFGEDEAGEIYVVGLNGSVMRLANPDAVNTRQRPFSITDGGAFVASTAGSATAVTVGYGRIQSDAGQGLPSGQAIIALRSRGILVSEAAIPASRAITTGRAFAEMNSDANTGLALVNPNDQPALVSFYFTNTDGTNSREGSVTIPPKQQFAAFLNEAPFNGATPFLGTFSFTSTVPVAPIALRGARNERGDFLMTSLPIAELGRAVPPATTIAHFASGAGWLTQVVLVNPSDDAINGTVDFIGSSGQIIRTVPYTLARRSSSRIVSADPSSGVQTGSVRISSSVIAFSIFLYRSNGVTITHAGVPSISAAVDFRVFSGSAGSVRTGLAIANPSDGPVDVRLEFSGITATVSIPATGQRAMFLNELPGFGNLSALRGTLRITSPIPIVVTGLRAHSNERGELIISTTTPVPEPVEDASELFFPHLVDGDGFSTELVLFGRLASGTIYFFDQAGNPASFLFQ